MKSKEEKMEKKVPDLRFPGFEGVWEEKRLGDVANFFSGGTPSSGNKNYYSGGTPFIRSAEIAKHETALFISDQAIKNSAVQLVESGDLLYALYGATSGEVAISNIKGAINQAILCIRTQENKIWLLNYLRHNKGRILAKYIQGGQGNLSGQIIKSLKISFSAKSEQKKIAEFLTTVDEWIENLKTQKEKWEEYKKGMMQKIFSQEVRFKADDGSEFPDWEERCLGEVTEFFKGRGVSKSEILEEGKSQCVRYGELYTKYGEVIREVVSRTDALKESSFVSQEYDLLVPSSGETAWDIAKATCILKEGVLLGGDMSVLRLVDGSDAIFFAYYLSHGVKRGMSRLAQGNSVVHLYPSYLKKMKLTVPCVAEQKKIAEFLSSIDNLISSQQKKITLAEQWKKGLMQRMFV